MESDPASEFCQDTLTMHMALNGLRTTETDIEMFVENENRTIRNRRTIRQWETFFSVAEWKLNRWQFGFILNHAWMANCHFLQSGTRIPLSTIIQKEPTISPVLTSTIGPPVEAV
jgi:hypothetical protein